MSAQSLQQHRDDNEFANGTYTLTFQFPGNSNNVNITVSAPGYATQTQTLAFTNNQTRTINWLLVPSITATTLTVAPATRHLRRHTRRRSHCHVDRRRYWCQRQDDQLHPERHERGQRDD